MTNPSFPPEHFGIISPSMKNIDKETKYATRHAAGHDQSGAAQPLARHYRAPKDKR